MSQHWAIPAAGLLARILKLPFIFKKCKSKMIINGHQNQKLHVKKKRFTFREWNPAKILWATLIPGAILVAFHNICLSFLSFQLQFHPPSFKAQIQGWLFPLHFFWSGPGTQIFLKFYRSGLNWHNYFGWNHSQPSTVGCVCDFKWIAHFDNEGNRKIFHTQWKSAS